MSEKEEEIGEVEEVSEALEEAPPDFVVDINGLEIMVRISDLLFEASRSSEPMKYIQEIEKLGSTISTKGKKKSERKPASTKKTVKKEKKKTS